MPLSSPLLAGWVQLPPGHVVRQKASMPLPMLGYLVEAAARLSLDHILSEPLVAAILVRALMSALRHQHMLRAESVRGRWTAALHVFQVSKGKSHGGA
eukprot:2333271-Amphidinium_carterae.1